MSPSGNLDWVWYGAGVVLALLGLALAYWSLLHDRARGRRRCPRCWYDMQAPGPDPLTCPECGHTAKREQDLSKICRSRNKGLMAILLVLVSCVIGTRPQWLNGQWVHYIPTTVLVHIAPLGEEYWRIVQRIQYPKLLITAKSPMTTELYRRLALEEIITDKHLGILMDRLHSDSSTRVPKIIYAHTKWPRDLTLGYFLASNPYILLNPSSVQYTIRARLKLEGHEWQAIKYSRRPEFKYFVTERFPRELHQVSFELEYYRAEKLVWSGESLPIELVDSIDEIMTPDDSIELEEKIRDKLRLELHPIPNFPFNIKLAKSNGVRLNSETWGLQIEVRNRDQVVATGHRLFARTYLGSVYGLGKSSEVNLDWDRESLLRACEDLEPQWRIVLVGDPEIALLDLGSDRYWSGEIELPIDWSEIERWCIYNIYEN